MKIWMGCLFAFAVLFKATNGAPVTVIKGRKNHEDFQTSLKKLQKQIESFSKAEEEIEASLPNKDEVLSKGHMKDGLMEQLTDLQSERNGTKKEFTIDLLTRDIEFKHFDDLTKRKLKQSGDEISTTPSTIDEEKEYKITTISPTFSKNNKSGEEVKVEGEGEDDLQGSGEEENESGSSSEGSVEYTDDTEIDKESGSGRETTTTEAPTTTQQMSTVATTAQHSTTETSTTEYEITTGVSQSTTTQTTARKTTVWNDDTEGDNDSSGSGSGEQGIEDETDDASATDCFDGIENEDLLTTTQQTKTNKTKEMTMLVTTEPTRETSTKQETSTKPFESSTEIPTTESTTEQLSTKETTTTPEHITVPIDVFTPSVSDVTKHGGKLENNIELTNEIKDALRQFEVRMAQKFDKSKEEVLEEIRELRMDGGVILQQILDNNVEKRRR